MEKISAAGWREALIERGVEYVFTLSGGTSPRSTSISRGRRSSCSTRA